MSHHDDVPPERLQSAKALSADVTNITASGSKDTRVRVDASDGWHAHPTQGLLDAYTLRDALGDLEEKRIVIVGDVLHSRVARSDINTLVPLGARITLSGPPTLIPTAWRCGQLPAGVRYESDLDVALESADAVIALRLQRERQEAGLLPSLREYSRVWGLTADRVAR